MTRLDSRTFLGNCVVWILAECVLAFSGWQDILLWNLFVLFNIHHVLSDLLLCESMQAFLLMVPIALPAMLPPGSIIRPSVLTAFTVFLHRYRYTTKEDWPIIMSFMTDCSTTSSKMFSTRMKWEKSSKMSSSKRGNSWCFKEEWNQEQTQQ